MREHYWSEVAKFYYVQRTRLVQDGKLRGYPEYDELNEAQWRSYEQLAEMCLAEHGSHLGDGSLIVEFCKRCGTCLD